MTRMSRTLVGALVLIAALAVALPASAQTGGLRGKVTDAKGQPVPDATVRIEGEKGSTVKAEVKTDKKGVYVRIGLFPGEYKVTAEKDNMKNTAEVRVALGDPTELDLQLGSGGGGAASAQQLDAKLRATFEEAANASDAGNYDQAIAKYNEAITLVPTCYGCYAGLGVAYAKKGDMPKAEESLKKAVELNASYCQGWNALAALYNQEKKFDEATAASEKAVACGGAPAAGGAAGGGAAGAGGGGNAQAIYNQGVILWNQGKYAEAKDKFEAATKADAKYGEAWYRLGMAYMNLGDTPKAVAAFEGYLQADPNGPHAAEVKGAVDALKPKQ